MGSAKLHGVLNMPIGVWGDDYADKVHRAARYIEASKLIDKLESENADLRAQLVEVQKDSERFESAIRNLHKVRGRHHTQQACEALFALVELKNNNGLEAKNDD